MWTQFHDMHSGGGCKEEPYGKIYIEAPEDEAKTIFYNRFGHNPERVTCTCCGDDYSITESKWLAQITGYGRGCRSLETPHVDGRYETPDSEEFERHYYLEKGEDPPKGFQVSDGHLSRFNKYQTLDEYLQNDDVLVIYELDIKPDERNGDVPEQGYVWRD